MPIKEDIENAVYARRDELIDLYGKEFGKQAEAHTSLDLLILVNENLFDAISFVLESKLSFPIIQRLKKLLGLDILLSYAISAAEKSHITQEEWIQRYLRCADKAESLPHAKKIIVLYQQLKITISNDELLLLLQHQKLEKLVQIFELLQQGKPTLFTEKNIKLFNTVLLDVNKLSFNFNFDFIQACHDHLKFLHEHHMLTQKFFEALMFAFSYDVSNFQKLVIQASSEKKGVDQHFVDLSSENHYKISVQLTGISQRELFHIHYINALQNLEVVKLIDKYFLKLSPESHHVVAGIADLRVEVVNEEIIDLILAIDSAELSRRFVGCLNIFFEIDSKLLTDKTFIQSLLKYQPDELFQLSKMCKNLKAQQFFIKHETFVNWVSSHDVLSLDGIQTGLAWLIRDCRHFSFEVKKQLFDNFVVKHPRFFNVNNNEFFTIYCSLGSAKNLVTVEDINNIIKACDQNDYAAAINMTKQIVENILSTQTNGNSRQGQLVGESISRVWNSSNTTMITSDNKDELNKEEQQKTEGYVKK